MRKHGYLIALVFCFAGCSSTEQTVETESPEVATSAESANPQFHRLVHGMAIQNARFPAPTLLTAGQISASHLEALETIGFEKFINLRLADEEGTGWEEEMSAAEGINFERIPVAGADGLTRENVERLAEALLDAESGMAVVYCASSNRVGALLALKAYWLDDVAAEEALELGFAGGLTRLEPAVRELLELPAGES